MNVGYITSNKPIFMVIRIAIRIKEFFNGIFVTAG